MREREGEREREREIAMAREYGSLEEKKKVNPTVYKRGLESS